MKTTILSLLIGLFFLLSMQGQNSVTILNRPTEVAAGDLIDFTVSYSKEFPTAKLLVKFHDTDSNSQLYFDISPEITENSGTITLSVQAPSTIGTHYELHAQLLEGWSGRASEIEVVEVINQSTAPTGDNTLEIVNTSSDPINNGTSRRVNVKYNLLEAGRILVEVRDHEVASGSNKIGEVWVDVAAGTATIELDLVVDKGHPGETNRIQAILFEENSWTPVSATKSPYLLVGKGDGTITYRGQSYGYNNDQNLLFEEALGNGYYTNWFVSNGWAGDIKAKFGAAEEVAWVDWDNNGFQEGQGHGEFDIKIQKYSWHNYKETNVDRGYPTKIASLNNDVVCTATGQWGPNSEGRTFLNMTAWLYTSAVLGGDNPPARCDIIIHTWDNSGNLAQKYHDNSNDNLEPIGTIESDGVVYDVLKRNTGGYGEAATYNLVPANNPRKGIWETPFETSPFDVSLNMKDILGKLIIKDAASSTPTLSNQWFVHGLEWTFIGSSGDTVGGDFVQDSKGKLTLSTYTIPDLNEQSPLGIILNKGESNNDLIYPNPFLNTITYKYDNQKNNSVVLELFSMDGRIIKTVKNSVNSNRVLMTTSQLKKGMYTLRIATDQNIQIKKLLKN